MDTVKVDIQKLQLLNDRLAQTIDALNQVRMSVQGIQHAPYAPAPYAPPYGYASPWTAYGSPSPYGVPQFVSPPYATPFPGFQHSPYTTPFATPFATPFVGAIPYGMPRTPVTTSLGAFSVPYVGNGLSHTGWTDPTMQARAAQTWPFAQTAWTPTITG